MRKKKSNTTRNPVTRSGAAPRFLYPSMKSNRLIKCESELEFISNDQHEFDHNIAFFSDHQREQAISGSEGPFAAYPDTERFTRGGHHEIIEVKAKSKLANRKVKARLNDIRQHYESDGVTYSVWTEDELHRNGVHRQLEELREYRKPGERRRLLALPEVTAALAQPLPSSLEDLAELLGGWPLVKRLLANEILTVDLNDPFGPAQPVRLH